MAEKIDLYSDRGKKLKSDVDLNAISPLRNAAIKKIIHDTKRSAAVSLAGIEKNLKTGKLGGKGRQLPGKEMDLDIVAKADSIANKIKELVQVDAGDDTSVTKIAGGKSLLVQVPSSRIYSGAEYVSSLTASAAAVTQAIIDEFNIGLFDAPTVKSAVWGTYPQTLGMTGGNVASVLEIPQKDEGFGFTLRNIMANHLAAVVKKNAMNGAALTSIYEQTGIYEMGEAIGMFERHQLLCLAYQGLNANNLVYGTVKKEGKTGTLGSVVHAIVERAIEDNVISADKKFASGYQTYKANDVALWNAYCCAGTLAGTMVNCGAARSPQAVSSSLLYFNDLVEKETGLPGGDYGKIQGTAVGFSFFSHSIYGGGGPGVFNGNHITTRHARGVAIPCVVAAICLDAGVQMYGPEITSGIVGEVFGSVDEFREPIKYVAEAV